MHVSKTKLLLPAALLGLGLAPRFASADVIISDLTEEPITATVSDSLNPGDNKTITADQATPQTVSFSISVDGLGSGSAVALFLEPGIISDILQVTVTQKERGMGIKYVQIDGTFTSDPDPGGLADFFQGLGLTDEIMTKVLANGLVENGTDQDIGSRLIDTMTGNQLTIPTTIKAASDFVPEPSSRLPLGLLLLVLAFLVRRRRGRSLHLGISRQRIEGSWRKISSHVEKSCHVGALRATSGAWLSVVKTP